MEPLKVSHKKKSDREQEKERLGEKWSINHRRWRQGREPPAAVIPREARDCLELVDSHHLCALDERRSSLRMQRLLNDAEGVGFIPADRYEPQCKIADKPASVG